ncbi:hypothetical protein VBD025_16010 [Virgibacillus flavescens]|uniref:hypothetical protein n=1 Tax=Virgibacillus flavescens TaxID=1611422 RepID=UPI003D331F1D
MTLMLRAMPAMIFVFFLAGCGDSVEEVLEDDMTQLEILEETETKSGNVVFYKTESPVETYGAKLLKKSGSDWEIVLGSEIPSPKDAENIAWGVSSTKDEPTFFYGIVKNKKIEKLTINGTDAKIINRKQGDNLFYLLTSNDIFSIQNNSEKGIQIEGFSGDGEVIYQRLKLN